MPQCAVCNMDISEEIDTPVGKTVIGTPEIRPDQGNQALLGRRLVLLLRAGLQKPVRLGPERLHSGRTRVTKLTLVTIVLTFSPECVTRA